MPTPTPVALTLLLFAMTSISFGQTRSQAEPDTAKETFVYKNVDGRELKLYVSKPTAWAPTDSRPAVVFFHGGGWTGGKPGQFDEHCKHLASRGMVCFQIQYRLLNKANNDPPSICINDAKTAMRWVRGRAREFGIDPNKIASGGGSAGGHLAAFLGTTNGVDDPNDDPSVSARSNAMLLFNPVFDNGPGGWGTKRVGDQFKEFSPAQNITEDDAPSIVFLGTEDKLIPVATAQRFQNEMNQARVRSELRLYAGAGHGFFNANKEGGKYFQLTVAEMDEFLVSLGWLTNP